MIQKRLIECLFAVSELGSFTKAANSLYMSQPSLSRTISNLEHELGVELFDRSAFPIKPTYFGKIYLQACREVFLINNSTMEMIREVKTGEKGHITLGLSRFLSRCITPEIVKRYKKKDLSTELSIVEDSSPALEDKLLEGKIDIALVTGKRNDAKLNYINIANEELVLVVTPDFAREHHLQPGKNNLPIPIEKTADFPYVFLKEGHGLRRFANRYFELLYKKPDIALETEDIDVACNLTNMNVGFSFSSSVILNIKDAAKPLYYCTLPGSTNTRAFNICQNKNVYHIKAEKELTDIIISIFDELTLTDKKT